MDMKLYYILSRQKTHTHRYKIKQLYIQIITHAGIIGWFTTVCNIGILEL